MEADDERAIEAAIAAWRGRHAATGLGAAQWEELEDHVRAGAGRLLAAGLDADEAVWVAARRAGSPHELAEEFARAGASPRAERLGWIIGGAFSLLVTQQALSVLSRALTTARIAGVWETPRGENVATALYFALYAIAAGVLVLVWRRASGAASALDAARRHRRATWLLLSGLGVGVAGANATMQAALVALAGVGWVASTWIAASAALVVAVPALLFAALLRLGRKSRAVGPVA